MFLLFLHRDLFQAEAKAAEGCYAADMGEQGKIVPDFKKNDVECDVVPEDLDQRQQLDATGANINVLSQQLRQLHSESGGIQLP